MRAIWKGAISFGLVSVPVKVYSATSSHDLPLHQVHSEDGGRIKYQRRCEECGKVVPYEDIDRAYEEGGRRVVLSDEDFELLPAERDHGCAHLLEEGKRHARGAHLQPLEVLQFGDHLGAGSEVQFDAEVVGVLHDVLAHARIVADRFEQAERADSGDVGGVGRLVEAHADMALGGEVVDLLRSDLANQADQTVAVRKVAVMQVELGLVAEDRVLDPLGAERT